MKPAPTPSWRAWLNANTFVGVAAGSGRCGQGVLYQLSLTGATVDGITNCGQRKNSGGGSGGPSLLLLPGLLGLAQHRRRLGAT